MDHHIDQTSSNIPTHSDDLQLAAITQADLNILLNTAKQLKYHYFAVEKQPLLSLPEKASQVSRTAFLSYLRRSTHQGVSFFCDPLTNT